MGKIKPVRKGLERPLIIRGLRQPFFLQFLLVLGVGAVFIMVFFVNVLHQNPGEKDLSGFVLKVGAVLAFIAVIYIFFRVRTNISKHTFKNTSKTISNKDLRKYLQ